MNDVLGVLDLTTLRLETARCAAVAVEAPMVGLDKMAFGAEVGSHELGRRNHFFAT